MALIIIDFDLTIIAKQTHNMLVEYKKNNKSACGHTEEAKALRWDQIKNILPIGDAREWQILFKRMKDEGHDVAIASFNSHGEEIIPRYLEEVIKLPTEILNNIYIYSPKTKEFPPDKNAYIQHISNHYKEKNNKKTKPILLVDDSEKNIVAAASFGYQVITATKEATHLNELANKLDIWKPNTAAKLFEQGYEASSESDESLEFDSAPPSPIR